MVAVETIRRAALWTLIASSAFVAIEPSPYEFLFAVMVIAFAGGGFRFDRAFIPMILTMALFNAGGFIALAPYVDLHKSVTFTFITSYITLTMIAFAALIAERPEGRLATIRAGYIFRPPSPPGSASSAISTSAASGRCLRSTTAAARRGRSRTPTCSALSSSRRSSGSPRTC